MRFLLLVLLVSALQMNMAMGQDSARIRTAGIFTGVGFELNQPTRYSPVFLGADLSWKIGRRPAESFFSWYLTPQFNLAFTIRPVDFEFGCNTGLRYHRKISASTLLYGMIGAGPHYITANQPSQAGGFIFSDNFAIGIYRFPKNRSQHFMNFQLRYRHLSNASLKQPNAGIDTFNFIVGVGKFR